MDKVLLNFKGKVYKFSSNRNSILLNIAGENSDEINLIDNAISDFDVGLKWDEILITYFSKEQNVVLAHLNDDNKVIKKILYHYNDKSFFADNFRLIIFGGTLHLFFIEHNLSTPKKLILKHFVLNNTFKVNDVAVIYNSQIKPCILYTSPSPRD